MLEIKNLSVRTNKEKIYLLKNISFSLKKGDCLGIIGKSGDGKSTLAKALLNICDNNVIIEQGKVLLNNQEVNELHRGKKLSLMFQNPNCYLNPLMKVGKQIEEMLTYHFKESKKEAKKKAISFMNDVGIVDAGNIYNYYPHEISGGMQQRICLCIALICKPEVLILDESISYLDSNSKKDIIKLLINLQKEQKFTLIVISHDFKEIYKLCDKIAIMRNGQMIEFGNKEEIVLNPIHPYTIEILLDFLRYKENIPTFSCPLLEIEVEEPAPITNLSSTHYVRSWYLDKRAPSINLPANFATLKEKIYENLRNQ